MKKVYFILTVLFSIAVYSQKKDSLPNFNDEYFLIKNGDSLVIELEEVTVLPKHKFKSRTDANYYQWFKRKVFKAYPYAKLASERIDSVNVRLSRMKSKRHKKKYIRRVQKYVEKELTDPLKKLTRTEGRVLIKLIHRQTGKTAFDNVKELRSGWKAFWYNTSANLFKLSLKDEYKPASVNEDYLIEDILQRAYINEELERQAPKLKFDAIKVLESKKGQIDVEKYKRMFSKQKKRKKS